VYDYILQISKEFFMNNLILFINSFLSYLLVFAVIVVVVAVAVAIGITLRKKKDAKEMALESAAADKE